MSEEKILDEAIYDLGIGGIEPRKKIPVTSIGMAIVGIILLVAAFTVLKSNPDLSSGSMLCGILLIIAGVIKLAADLGGKRKPYYKPTGEFLKRYELNLDLPNKAKAIESVEEGDFETLADLSAGESSAVKVVVYKTAGDELAIAQVLQYVPHTYRGAGPIRIFGKGEFIRSAKFR